MFFTTKMFLLIMILSMTVLNVLIAGEPTKIPWPIGYSESEMHYSRDLLRTYGNTNGIWGSSGNFHPGIDIPYNTEVVDACNEVRCVKAGFVTYETSSLDDIEGNVIVICDENLATADYGWCYQHLSEFSWRQNDFIPYGALIDTMETGVGVPHVHFMWTDAIYQEPRLCYVNPLNFLDPSPLESEGFTWTWNPEGNDPPYEYFFLPYMRYQDWDNLSVDDTFNAMLDKSNLSGHIDFFLGQYLSGKGTASGTTQAPWLSPRRIKWSVSRITESGNTPIQTKHVVDFDCVLAGTGERASANSSPVEIRRDGSGCFSIVSSGSSLSVTVFDLAGRSVWSGTSSTGEVLWNRCNSSGNTVPSGVYLIMVESDDIDTYTTKVVVR